MTLQGQRISFGLIGCGNHSAEVIVPTLASISDARCAWVSDPDNQSRINASRRLGNCLIFEDWRAAVQEHKPDCIVCVATPQLHETVAEFAIGQDIPVFIEKPPGVDLASVSKLADLASGRGAITQIGHNLRFSEGGVQVHRMCRAKSFGRHSLVNLRYHASGQRGDRWGLGSSLHAFLLSHLVHAVDYLLFVSDLKTGLPNSVTVDQDCDKISVGLMFDLHGGGVGALTATNLGSYFDFGATIVGENGDMIEQKGLVEVNVFQRDMEKRWSQKWQPKILQAGPDFAGYHQEIVHFFKLVLRRTTSHDHADFQSAEIVYGVLDKVMKAQRVFDGPAPSVAAH